MEEEADRRRTEGEGRASVIHVRLGAGAESVKRAPETTLHYLPFLIDYEGPAPSINNFFIVESDKQRQQQEEGTTATSTSSTSSSSSSSATASSGGDDDDVLRATFRGRLLRGKTLPLPSDYQGVILKEGYGRAADGAMQWDVSSKFNEWTYWNHDSRPHATDLPQQWMQWLQLSQQIHEPITQEEIEGLSATNSS